MFLLFQAGLAMTYSEGCNFLIRNNKAALLTGAADLAFSLGWEKAEESGHLIEQLTLPIDLSPEERTNI